MVKATTKASWVLLNGIAGGEGWVRATTHNASLLEGFLLYWTSHPRSCRGTKLKDLPERDRANAAKLAKLGSIHTGTLLYLEY
ncbi:hypothetical protein CR513_34990, partial [Mucuna pruriens]